jgi:hypothetical protein
MGGGKLMTLYDLTAEYQALLQMAEDPDTDPEVLTDTMEALEGEIEDKADGYAKVIRQITTDTAGVTAEIERLTKLKKSMEGNVQRLKNNLQFAMEATGKTKFKTGLFSFGIQKNPPSVIMDEQYLGNIPKKYLVQQDPVIDKKKIKEDLKAGVDLEGIAHLAQTESLRIR